MGTEMSKAISFYLDGMISFGALSTQDQVWLFVNKREFVPSEAMLFCLSQ